jgi:hypothetical protein
VNKKLVLSVLSTAVVASMAASAMAKPNAGFYVGGNVDKYYSIDAFLNHLDTALDEIIDNLGSTTFVDENGKAAPFLSALNAQTEEELNAVTESARLDHFEKNPYTIVDGTGSYNPEEDEDLLPPVDGGELKVESVSAIDATHLKVQFGTVVDVVTGSAQGNYGVYAVGSASNLVAGVELSNNKTYAVITLSSPLTNQDANYTVKVDGVKDNAGNVIKDFSQVYTLSDAVRPTIGDITFVDSKTIKFTVSEEVDANNTPSDSKNINAFVAVYDEKGVKKFGYSTSGSEASYNAIKKEVTINIGSLVAGNYTVRVSSLTDKAGNLVTPNPTVKAFTVSTDTVKPEVTSVKALGIKGSGATAQGVLEVVFSEPLSGTPGSEFAVEVDGAANSATITNPSGDKKTFLVELAASSSTAGLHKITIKTYTDLANNNGDAKSVFVTFATDAPKVSGAQYVTTSTGNKVVVKFDRPINVGTFATISNVTYITPNNVEKTLSIDSTALSVADVDGDGVNELVINADDFDGAGTVDKLPAGSYTLTLPAGFVQDSAGQANTATKVTFVVPGSTTETEVTVDASNTKQLADVNYVQVTFSDEVDTATALDPNNYTVEGQKVFEGQGIFLDDAHKTVKLKLKADAIKEDGTYTFEVNGVKDADGKAVKAYSGNITLKENEAPYIVSAEITKNDTIVVTFNEAFQNDTDVDADDFIVTVNGTKATLSATDAVTSGDTVTFTLPNALQSTNDKVTITTADAFDGVDANGNIGKVGQTVEASWKLD